MFWFGNPPSLPPSPPFPNRSGNSNLASYFLLKTLAFDTLLSLGISNNLSQGRYGYSLECNNKNVFLLVESWNYFLLIKLRRDYYN